MQHLLERVSIEYLIYQTALCTGLVSWWGGGPDFTNLKRDRNHSTMGAAFSFPNEKERGSLLGRHDDMVHKAQAWGAKTQTSVETP